MSSQFTFWGMALGALLCGVGCDDRPKSKYEIMDEQRRTSEAREAATIERLQGKTVFLALPDGGPPSLYNSYHVRKDCPELETSLKYKHKLHYMKVRDGRLQNDKGFYYSAEPCTRCIK